MAKSGMCLILFPGDWRSYEERRKGEEVQVWTSICGLLQTWKNETLLLGHAVNDVLAFLEKASLDFGMCFKLVSRRVSHSTLLASRELLYSKCLPREVGVTCKAFRFRRSGYPDRGGGRWALPVDLAGTLLGPW